MGMDTILCCVRIRPLLPVDHAAAGRSEQDPKKGLRRIVNALDDRVLVFGGLTGAAAVANEQAAAQRMYRHGAKRNKEIRYAFDRVFSEEATQQDVFEATTKPLIDDVLRGYNATLFAYGATGCGTEKEPGVIFRAMKELFSRIQRNADKKTDVTVSYLEVYNETIRDLLAVDSTNTLDVREDDTRVIVAGLSEHRPKNVDDVMKMLLRGNENRTRAPTEANEVSSRSHAILQVHIRQKNKTCGMVDTIDFATLSIIDLAGSERASVTKNKGERLIEGANINRLLKFSLDGNCKVVMIANISPALIHYEETHNTLKYANRAKNIKTKAFRNSLSVDNHISQYPKIIEELRSEIGVLKQKLAAEEDSGCNEDEKVENLEAYNFLLMQVAKHYDKIRDYEWKKSTTDLETQRNDHALNYLSTVISSMPESDIPQTFHGTEFLNYYFEFLDSMIQKKEMIHSRNAALRHNSGELAAAVERHQAELDKVLQETSEIQLPESLTTRLHLEATILKLSKETEWLRNQVKLYAEALTNVSGQLSEFAAFHGKSTMAIYDTMSKAVLRNDAVSVKTQIDLIPLSAELISRISNEPIVKTPMLLPESITSQPPARKAEGQSGGMAVEEVVQVIYDTASESESEAESAKPLMSDAMSTEESGLDDAWQTAVDTFKRKSVGSAIKSSQKARLSGTPNTAKRRRLDKRVQKALDVDDEDEEVNYTPTKIRLRSRAVDHSEAEATPKPKPRQKHAVSAKKPPLSLNANIQNQTDAAPTNAGEIAEPPPIKTEAEESPKRTRKRHLRQSLIPKIRKVVYNKAKLRFQNMLIIVWISIVLSTGITSFIGNEFAIQAKPWYGAREYVTILGMLLGNSSNVQSDV
ncbi:kinesin-like protein Klp5 [Phlyctochytrium bullatum]|nr:kinesin-like protein Klp5 [Phlyctochytrium bullatum]